LAGEQKYHVTFDKILSKTHPARAGRSGVDHPPFVGAIKSLEFYQDRGPAIRQVVATLEFTHRVDHVALENHIASP